MREPLTGGAERGLFRSGGEVSKALRAESSSARPNYIRLFLTMVHFKRSVINFGESCLDLHGAKGKGRTLCLFINVIHLKSGIKSLPHVAIHISR